MYGNFRLASVVSRFSWSFNINVWRLRMALKYRFSIEELDPLYLIGQPLTRTSSYIIANPSSQSHEIRIVLKDLEMLPQQI